MAPFQVNPLGPLTSAVLRRVLASRLLLACWILIAWLVLLPTLSVARRVSVTCTQWISTVALLLPSIPFFGAKPSRKARHRPKSTKSTNATTATRTSSSRRLKRQQSLPIIGNGTAQLDTPPLPLAPSPPVSGVAPSPAHQLAPSQPLSPRQRKRSNTTAGTKRALTASSSFTLRPLHPPHPRFPRGHLDHPTLDDSITTSTSITATLPHIPPLSIQRPSASLFSTASTSSSSSESPLTQWGYPERYFFLANNLRVHYIDVSPPTTATGKPIKGTLILLHGVLDWSASAFAKHIPMYLDLGYRVVAVDFPGHGKSDMPLDVARAHTFGLYVTTVVDLFTQVLMPDPAAAGAGGSGGGPMMAVVAQGLAATFFSLACAASPHVATCVTHLVLLSPGPSPLTTKRDALLLVLGARACTHVLAALPPRLVSWFLPSPHTVSRALSATGTPSSLVDVPGTSLRVPLTLLSHQPVPYLADVPTERILALFDATPARWATRPAATPHAATHGWASPGAGSFDSAITGLGPSHASSTGTRSTKGSGRVATWLARLVAHVAHVADRATALDLAAAHLHLREWAHAPPPPPPPPPPPARVADPAPQLPPPRRQVLVVYGAQDPLVGGGAQGARAWTNLVDAQGVVCVATAGTLVAGEAAVACVNAIAEFLDTGA